MALTLGRTKNRKEIRLTNEERSRHVHVIGASGTGKSKLLEAMIRADITAGPGLCLIDPHGTLADAVARWRAATRIDDVRRIHLIETGNLDWCAGFNPLRLDGRTEPAVRVDAMVSACAQVWGGENTNSTPLLKKCLRAVLCALATRDLTLAEAPLLTVSDSGLRRRLIYNLPDPVSAAVWRDFDALSRRDFFEQFSSTNNRLLEFLSAPVVRRIVGQTTGALDLRHVMDVGEIVIVNLASKGALSPDNGRLLGTLLTSELFLQALRRDEGVARRRPFTLYIDECYDYLTADVERMLDQTRKFGLHLVLAHQRLGQLRDRSEAIYNGVMAGGKRRSSSAASPTTTLSSWRGRCCAPASISNSRSTYSTSPWWWTRCRSGLRTRAKAKAGAPPAPGARARGSDLPPEARKAPARPSTASATRSASPARPASRAGRPRAGA